MLSEENKKILENIGEDERIVFAGYNYRKQYHAGDMINCYVDDDIWERIRRCHKGMHTPIYFQCESGTFDEVTDKIKRFCDEGITVNISNYKMRLIKKKKNDSSIVDDTVFHSKEL